MKLILRSGQLTVWGSLVNEYDRDEAAILRCPSIGSDIIVGRHYYGIVDGAMDPEERWCCTVGEGSIIYHMEKPWISFARDNVRPPDGQWWTAGRHAVLGASYVPLNTVEWQPEMGCFVAHSELDDDFVLTTYRIDPIACSMTELSRHADNFVTWLRRDIAAFVAGKEVASSKFSPDSLSLSFKGGLDLNIRGTFRVGSASGRHVLVRPAWLMKRADWKVARWLSQLAGKEVLHIDIAIHGGLVVQIDTDDRSVSPDDLWEDEDAPLTTIVIGNDPTEVWWSLERNGVRIDPNSIMRRQIVDLVD